MRALTADERFCLCNVCPQSISGLIVSGMFYGWGSLVDAIDKTFNPEDYTAFRNQHGTFTGVIILCFTVMPMPLLRILLETKRVTEFQIQLIGMIMLTISLFFAGIALQFKNLYVLYILFTIPAGFGGLAVYQRLVFIHMGWFKKIGRQHLGAGIFGGAIGFWTVLFFLLSVPILKALPIYYVLYIYAAICPAAVLGPLLLARDVDASLNTTLSVNEEKEKAEQFVDEPFLVEEGKGEEKKMSVIEHNSDNNKTTALDVAPTPAAVSVSIPSTPSPPSSSSSSSCRRREPIPITDPSLLALAHTHHITIDSNGEYDLTYREMMTHPSIWLLTLFFTTILTPGWGIKLGSLAILRAMFHSSTDFAAQSTALLFGGLVAERLGATLTYDLLLVAMLVCLVIVPQTATSMPHASTASSGCQFFVVLICIIGLMYGGCVALFYSIVFDIFGPRNYRTAFGLCLWGFGVATAIGGLSSAYSFSSTAIPPGTPDVTAGAIAGQWFYAMAGAVLFGLFLLHVLKPIDFNQLLVKKLKGLGVHAHTDIHHATIAGSNVIVDGNVN